MNSSNPSQPEPAIAEASPSQAQTAARRPRTRRASAKPIAPAKPASRSKPTVSAKAAKVTKAAKAPNAAKTAKTMKPSKPLEASDARSQQGQGPAKASARKPAVAAKPERLKLVRDSFTMPKSDVDLIAALKQRCLKLGHEAKKSELLRAGLHALAALQDEALVAAASAVPRLKTGRPGQKKGK